MAFFCILIVLHFLAPILFALWRSTSAFDSVKLQHGWAWVFSNIRILRRYSLGVPTVYAVEQCLWASFHLFCCTDGPPLSCISLFILIKICFTALIKKSECPPYKKEIQMPLEQMAHDKLMEACLIRFVHS